MSRRLFCEISPLTYEISLRKQCMLRHLKDAFKRIPFAKEKADRLPELIYSHNSLIRRQLGNVDMRLQENKATNLALAAPRVDRVLIRPGETFSFWRLVGKCTKAKGYQQGLTITASGPSKGIGGGMCQFTNLLHWLVLHSPLTLVEHHHHDGVDLFPDFGRQVPFGCGTSILYNYLDYQFRNDTDNTFQLRVYTTEKHLCGELRAERPLPQAYHIVEKERYFTQVGADYYRHNQIYREVVDKKSGKTLRSELLKASNAKVLYSADFIPPELLRVEAPPAPHISGDNRGDSISAASTTLSS